MHIIEIEKEFVENVNLATNLELSREQVYDSTVSNNSLLGWNEKFVYIV